MASPTAASIRARSPRALVQAPYVQVLCAIAIGVFLGHLSPELTPAWIPDWMRIAPAGPRR